MERGFKSRCEAISRSLRLDMGLSPIDQLSAQLAAEYLEVSLWSLKELELKEEDFHQLACKDGESWSAFTVSAFGRDAIVVNPSCSEARYSSNVMHELAHLILGHQPNTMFFVGNGEVALRGFNQTIEEEANWLAGSLLLPRTVLVYLKRSRMSQSSACNRYCVSKEMLRYRLNVTGVNRQFRKSKQQSREHV